MDGTTLLWMLFKLGPRQLLILGTYDFGVTAVQLSPRNNKHCCQNPEDAEGLTALLSQERLLGQRRVSRSGTQHSPHLGSKADSLPILSSAKSCLEP